MNTKAENKVNILSDTLKEFFGDKMNLARIKFFGLFISALCKVQTVCFEKLACSFDSDVRVDSSLRRIQRFISEYSLDSDMIARFVFSLLHINHHTGWYWTEQTGSLDQKILISSLLASYIKELPFLFFSI